MARSATAPELVLFRTPGQWSRYRAAIYSPTTIYTARVNQSFSTRDKVLELAFDTGSGTLADVLPDMTVFIGSSAGAWDKGITRVRSIDSDTLFIGETADINFADNDYITIVDDFGLWAKPILISSGVVYMDGGIAYSDQHSNYLPLIRGGPTGRVIRKTGSSVSVSFDFPATVPGSSVSSRSTSAPGSASITGGTTQTPTIQWSSVGWKKVYHTVTAANGKSFFIVRYVFVWDETNEPEPVEISENARGDVEAGGWSVGLTLYDSASLSLVRDHAFIILFSEDHYGGTEDEIGPVSGCENIAFEGWIAKESIDWRSEGGSVTFTAYGPHFWLQKIPAWPDGVQFTTATPAKWTHVKNLTVDLGLVHHFLQWRTTAPRILDIFPTGDSKISKEVSSLASDLWSQIREMAFDQLFARALCNRLGQLYIEIHPQLIPAGSRTHPTVMTILEKDIEDGVDLGRVTMDEASIVDLSGVAINSAGKGTSYFSLSPGHSHSHYGSPVVINRILLSSQSQANQLAGLYRGWLNNPYPSISLRLSANNRLIDICPLQKCALTISSGDTIRGISESLGLIPLSIEETFDPSTGYARQEVTFEAETFEDLSVNGDVPGSGNVSIPPLPPLPPLPPIEILTPGTTTEVITDDAPRRVLLKDENAGLMYTENFNEASPNYELVNAGLTQAQYTTINKILIDPAGGIYVAHRRRSGFGTIPFIAYAPSIGSTFMIIEDDTTIAAKFPGISPVFVSVNAIGIDPISGTVAYIIGVDNNFGAQERALFLGSGTSFTQGVDLTSELTTGNVGGLSYGHGEWRLTASPNNTNNYFYRIAADGSSVLDSTDSGATISLHVPIASSDAVFMWKSDGLIRVTNNGTVPGDFTTILGSDVNTLFADTDNRIATDPSGSQILTTWDTGQRGKSNDGGSSFSGMPGLTFGGDYAYDYAGGIGTESRWVAALGIIRYSEDFGDIWEAKDGDANLVTPVPSFTIIKVLR